MARPLGRLRPEKEPKRRPYALARRAMWEDGRVGKSALRVYLEMESAAGKDRLCWLSVETIGERLSMDKRAVQRARSELKDLGKIEYVTNRTMPGRGLVVAVYRLLAEQPAPDESTVPADEAEPVKSTAPADEPPRSNKPAAPVNRGSRPGKFDQPPRSNLPPNQESFFESMEEDDDEERAHAHEASSSSDHDFSDEGQALLIFDEMAGRLGWPIASRLTAKERDAMTARLRNAGGLQGWRDAMAEAERSAYLASTRPGLKFFLDEDHFAQLMRGRYSPEQDPPSRGPNVSDVIDWMFERRADDGSFSEARTEVPPAPAPPVDELAVEIATLAQCVGRPEHIMRVKVRECRDQLVAAGMDAESARAAITTELQGLDRGPYMLDQLRAGVATMASNLTRAA